MPSDLTISKAVSYRSSIWSSSSLLPELLLFLSDRFNIYALDLLGFGHSEKPPLSYTQYTWQDQVRDFVLEIVQDEFFRNSMEMQQLRSRIQELKVLPFQMPRNVMDFGRRLPAAAILIKIDPSSF